MSEWLYITLFHQRSLAVPGLVERVALSPVQLSHPPIGRTQAVREAGSVQLYAALAADVRGTTSPAHRAR